MNVFARLALMSTIIVLVVSPIGTVRAAPPPQLLLSKVQIGPGKQELIEIYNPTAQEVPLAGWEVQFFGDPKKLTQGVPTRVVWRLPEVLLAPGEFYAARHARAAISEVTEQFTVSEGRSSGSLAEKGVLRLVRQKVVVDAVGWGGMTGGEGAPAKLDKKVDGPQALQRCQAAGSLRDTDDNAADFRHYAHMQPGVAVPCAALQPPAVTPAPPPAPTPPTPTPPVSPPPAVQPPPAQQPSTPGSSSEPLTPSVPPPSLDNVKPPDAAPVNLCTGLRLYEIGAGLAQQAQFIEVKNTTQMPLRLTGCRLMTQSHPTNYYAFGSQELPPGGVLAVPLSATPLRLTKTKPGTVFLLDGAGREIDEVSYQKLPEGASWVQWRDAWQLTFRPTPGGVNAVQPCREGYAVQPGGMCKKISLVDDVTPPGGRPLTPRPSEPSVPAPCKPGQYRSADTGRCRALPIQKPPAPCAEGYYRHPETGRCRKIAAPKRLTPCKEGQYRSEVTGRCRSIATVAAKVLKPCPDGQFRHPETGRCRKIALAEEVVKQCPEGFERNPDTNRCRKIKTSTPPQVDFKPEAVQQVASATWGWWVFGGVGLLAVGYGVWQWRWELGQLLRRVGVAFTSGKK